MIRTNKEPKYVNYGGERSQQNKKNIYNYI